MLRTQNINHQMLCFVVKNVMNHLSIREWVSNSLIIRELWKNSEKIINNFPSRHSHIELKWRLNNMDYWQIVRYFKEIIPLWFLIWFPSFVPSTYNDSRSYISFDCSSSGNAWFKTPKKVVRLYSYTRWSTKRSSIKHFNLSN